MSQTAQFPIGKIFGLQEIPEKVTTIGYSDSTNPHIPATDKNYVFRKAFLREVLAFLKDPSGDALFITGPTGSGKTSGVTEIAARLNWPVQQVTAHGRMELSDLIGHHALVAGTPGEAPSMKFMYGPLAIAMKEGHILLINELDLADPSEIAGLNDVIEGRPLVISQNGGEIIKPHSMFRIAATGNSTGMGDQSGLYQGILIQNLAFMDRFRFTEVSYASNATELGILERVTPRLPETIRKGMVRIAGEVRKLFLGGEDNQEGEISLTMSTRTLVRWAKLSLAFRGAPNALEYALDQALLIRAAKEEKEAIIRIAKDVFGDSWQSDSEKRGAV